MNSKKFGGLDISELDKAAELEPKTIEPDPVDPRFREWVEPAPSEPSGPVIPGSLKPEPIGCDYPIFVDPIDPIPTAPSDPVPADPSDPGPIVNPGPMVEPGPIVNPGPMIDPGPIVNPGPIANPGPISDPGPVDSEPDDSKDKKEKSNSGPGLLDPVPLLGSLIRAVQNHRFGFLAWVLFNMVILGGIFEMFMENQGFLIGSLVYLAGLFIVTTPIGELITVWQNGWKPMKPEQQLSRVDAILDQVFFEAKEQNPWLNHKPRLYYDAEEYPNAYAFGRGSLCVTKGLLEYCTDDEIQGILAHEMGHLAYRHPDEKLIVHVGNIFISIFLMIIGIICNTILALVSNLLDNSRFFAAIGKGLNYLFSSILVRAWYGLGNLFTRSSSINEEYDADAYAAELGYSRQLCDALATIDNGSESMSGSWAALMGDHPSTADRILRMQGK